MSKDTKSITSVQEFVKKQHGTYLFPKQLELVMTMLNGDRLEISYHRRFGYTFARKVAKEYQEMVSDLAASDRKPSTVRKSASSSPKDNQEATDE